MFKVYTLSDPASERRGDRAVVSWYLMGDRVVVPWYLDGWYLVHTSMEPVPKAAKSVPTLVKQVPNHALFAT